MKVAILTSQNQWFSTFALDLQSKIKNSKIFHNHKNINISYEIVFILGYHKVIEEKYLKLHKHNLVIHESALPEGKGWAPMFWQILEGKNEIIFTLFEASNNIDNGDIYMQKTLHLNGYELNNQLRKKQALLTINMCIEFLDNYQKYSVPKMQIGKETFFKKRTPKDSELDINKTINEQFNLLRIVDNESYPAFFYKNGKKYILKIDEANNENR